MFDLNKIENHIGFVNGQSVVEYKDYWQKIMFCSDGVLHPFQIDMYEKEYGSVEKGLEEVFQLLNSLSNDIIIEYEYKNNWYLEYKTKKFPDAFNYKGKHWFMHTTELFEQYNHDYTQYTDSYIKNAYKINQTLYPITNDQLNYGNVIVKEDFTWQVIDFDDVVRNKYNYNLTQTYSRLKYDYIGEMTKLIPRAIKLTQNEGLTDKAHHLMEYSLEYMTKVYEECERKYL